MKKIFLPLVPVIAFAMTLSCSSDDTTEAPETMIPDAETPDETPTDNGIGILRITEVDAANDLVTLSNLGDGTLDVGDFFLCLGPGTYATVGGLATGATQIAPNASLTVGYDVDENADGLGVFATNDFSTTDSSILLDYVQWGGANQARVDQAVTAGRWDDAANFAPGVSVFTFDGTVASVGSTFWSGLEEEQEEAVSIVRILNVDAQGDLVTLANLGNTPIDVATYWLCLGPGTYINVGDVATGDTTLDANETITLPYNVNPMVDGLSIFSTSSFGSSDPTVLVDYVQWGAGNQSRSDQAVTAGRWDSADNFVPQATEYDYIGGAQDVGVDFWE